MAKYGFLKWCIEVTNSDLSDSKKISELAEKAIAEGFFSNRDFAKSLLEIEGPALQANVKAFATVNDLGKPFDIQIIENKSFRKYSVNPKNVHKVVSKLSGTVSFVLQELKKVSDKKVEAKRKEIKEYIDNMPVPVPVEDKGAMIEGMLNNWMLKKQRVPNVTEDFQLNDLVGRFYDAVEKYWHDKNCGYDETVLRICKYEKCQKPFLGRLGKQKCCCKRHGEIYHNTRRA